jgi:uncharacterized protein YydD (DUF2326 family)
MYKLFFILLFGVFSCTGPEELEESKPTDLLEKKEMVEIMSDLAIIEGHVQSKYKTVIAYNKIMTQSGRAYLKSKGVSEDRYERSFDYYLSVSSEMKSITSQVIERLNRKKLELEKD